MRSNEYLFGICLDIYRDMYKVSTPSADFDELTRKGVTKKRGWFMGYYLPISMQESIIDKHCRERRCSRREREAIRTEIFLGCSPRGVEL